MSTLSPCSIIISPQNNAKWIVAMPLTTIFISLSIQEE
jgi:hypothetical protein